MLIAFVLLVVGLVMTKLTLDGEKKLRETLTITEHMTKEQLATRKAARVANALAHVKIIISFMTVTHFKMA